MTTTTTKNKNFTDHYNWAINVTEKDAINCFNRLSNSVITLMNNGQVNDSIKAFNDLENITKAYNSHLSDNKAFYYGNDKAVQYLNDLQSKIIDIVNNTDKLMYEAFLNLN